VNDSVWDQFTFETESRLHPPPVSEEERGLALKLIDEWRSTGGYIGHLFWTTSGLAENVDLRQQLGLDARPVACAYTNLTFESSVVGKDRAFSNQFEWITALVSWFRDHPSYQLVLRCHPAELRKDHWCPNESLTEFIKSELSPLPENIRLIGPDAGVSSYGLGMLSSVVLVYSSTLGLELAERGKSVITAAHVHYAGRGFTKDPLTSSEYFQCLGAELQIEFKQTAGAHQGLVDYLAWFMFRRLSQFEAILNVGESWPRIRVRRLKELGSSRMTGVLQICRLIADGSKWW
jgi:hypothetical protein